MFVLSFLNPTFFNAAYTAYGFNLRDSNILGLMTTSCDSKNGLLECVLEKFNSHRNSPRLVFSPNWVHAKYAS